MATIVLRISGVLGVWQPEEEEEVVVAAGGDRLQFNVILEPPRRLI